MSVCFFIRDRLVIFIIQEVDDVGLASETRFLWGLCN